ncbi:hypothetical protein C7474_1505 [Microbacterium telephonicum]|uniref:Uncharacterized protein n=1 Tax=Microbacterium telephonicum TaxID=1714841 RepID=A0A498C8W9_9MICO|nr:hypothetical protein C7474_1505 [Microbacterium telephonicum]
MMHMNTTGIAPRIAAIGVCAGTISFGAAPVTSALV